MESIYETKSRPVDSSHIEAYITTWSIYVEVVKPERLVYAHISGPRFQVTVTFSEEGSKPRLHM